MGKKISELQDKVSLSGNERIPFEQDNTNGSITTSSLKNYISEEIGGGITGNSDKQELLNTNSNIGFVSKGDYEANTILFSGKEWIGQIINLHFTQTDGNGAIQLSTTEAEDAIWTNKSMDNILVPDKFTCCKVLYQTIHLQDDINATFKPKSIEDDLDLVKNRLYNTITEPAGVIDAVGNINLENNTIVSNGYSSVYFQNTEDDVMELYLKGYSNPYEKKCGVFGFSMSKPDAGVQLENVFISNFKKQDIDLIVKLQPRQFIYISGNENKVKASIIRDIKYFVDKQAQSTGNVLCGKKYAACGDSFTEAVFQNIQDESGLTGKNSPELWDAQWNCWKSYAYHIAKRNNMVFYQNGVSGSTMHVQDDNSFAKNRYNNTNKIPLDTDYLTIMFGLNENDIADSPETLGDENSSDDTTWWGAWNKVLKYYITNMPNCKIGIIIADSWFNEKLRDATIKIAEYYGIPYLDLKGDPKVPMMIGGRYSSLGKVSPEAVKQRNKAFQISDEDKHPNPKAHIYRSTIIENFLRSL